MLIRNLNLRFHTPDATAGDSAASGGGTPTPADAAAAAQKAIDDAAAKAVADAAAAKPEETKVDKVEDLPDWAQKEIAKTRQEAAKYRTEKAAESTKLENVLKFLGIGADGKPVVDPEKAAETAIAKAADAERKLAIFMAANGKADPAKLLDSKSFNDSVATVDPSDSAAITALIEAAVTANPNLKTTAQAAGSSGLGNLAGGGDAGKITEEEMIKLSKEDPEKLDKLHREGKLTHLLT